MKNTIKFLGIIALVAVIGFSMAACGGGDDGGGGGGGGGVATKGKLEITGLDTYNGKYAVAFGSIESGGDHIVIQAGGKVNVRALNGAKISGGKVTLKVWAYKSQDFSNFEGSGSGTVQVTIGTGEDQTSVKSPIADSEYVNITFTNGDGGTITPATYTPTH